MSGRELQFKIRKYFKLGFERGCESKEKFYKIKEAKLVKRYEDKIKDLEMLSRAYNNLRIYAEETKSLAFQSSKTMHEELKREKQKNAAFSNEIQKLKDSLRKVEHERNNALIKLKAQEIPLIQNLPGDKRKPVWEPQLSLPYAKRSRNYTKN